MTRTEPETGTLTKLEALNELGQSVWYDNLRRAMLDSGELAELIADGVTGVTSNPSIFEKAIGGSADYDSAIAGSTASETAEDADDAEAVYESLAIADIRRTADLLAPIYERTDGLDGYVSFEVSPRLAHDTDGTVAAAHRLFDAIGRSNVMIKVPATEAGMPAIAQLIASGVNINITLLFSLASYEAVVEAYLGGLERLIENGGDPAGVASVASFFVSRVDVAVDEALASTDDDDLAGTIAIANAKLAYARFRELFSGERWAALEHRGARPQRLLWASTGTKDPAYPDTLYVDALIGSPTVDTVPPATLEAFRDHGTVAPTLDTGLAEARERLERLAALGIDLDDITDRLLVEAVEKFEDSFDALLAAVDEKRQRLAGGGSSLEATLGAYAGPVEDALAELRDERVLRRIWQHDHTVWGPEPDEISNRLGWLHAPERMEGQIARLERFAASVRADGIRTALLLGMGGSSLAPEAFREIFGGTGRGEGTGGAGEARGAGIELRIIDSTDPDMIAERSRGIDPAETLYIVASKSGGTVETLSAFKHFYRQATDRLGSTAGRQFIAITDPGSNLERLGAEHDFREVFLGDPTVGGRYSALTVFGLVPAALVGVDLACLLDRARRAACNAASSNCPVAGDNEGARLGSILAELERRGRDKLTISTARGLESFADWIEQLIAESTGKQGRGILPVVREPLGDPDLYGPDRLFVDIALEGESGRDAALTALAAAGHPVVRLRLRDRYDIGAQIVTWEMATAIAGARMGINPFDQPNVEAAKIQAKELVARYTETGSFPDDESDGLPADSFPAELERCSPNGYVALQAFVAPTGAADRALAELRSRIRERFALATTVGYGPRFLHSTGQLHKGDGGNGLFVQFVSTADADIPIPDRAVAEDSSMSFQVLKEAQALGDARALIEAGRRVVRVDAGDAPAGAIRRLTESLM